MPILMPEPSEESVLAPTAPLSVALAAGAVLSACGGGSGGTSPAPAPAPAGISATQAARFLQQAQFSSSDADIAAVQNLGYGNWLDQQFSQPAGTTGWDWLMGKGYNDVAYINSVAPADFMIWNQLITSADAVRKRVALALSEIFVVSSNGVNIQSRSFAMAAYWDTLVAGALGNYRDLLEAITLNPAMGVYLNTKGNQKADANTGRQPDENYAREVLQLFSIGLYELNVDGSQKTGATGQPIETYDQSTITGLASVFTGWDFDTTVATIANPLQVKTPMRLNATLHSTTSATFLGTTIPANTAGAAGLKTALDTIFKHANVGPFIARQLIQRLVTSNPSAAYVGRVAAVFNNNGAGVRGDLRATVRALLLDSEARDAAPAAQADWGKLREPMLRFVQWARTFNATSSTGDWKINDLSDSASRLGQSPLRATSVFNFFRPGYVPPNTAFAANGNVAPEFQITNESTVAGYINFMQTVVRAGFADVAPNYATETALIGDPNALVDRLNLVLCAGQLSTSTLSTIKTAIASIAITTTTGQQNRLYAAVLLTMASPQYLVQK